jgi:hypothetical protein
MLMSGMVWEFLLIAFITKLSNALTITSPTNETNWTRDEALKIGWDSTRCGKRAPPKRYRAKVVGADIPIAVMIPPTSL